MNDRDGPAPKDMTVGLPRLGRHIPRMAWAIVGLSVAVFVARLVRGGVPGPGSEDLVTLVLTVGRAATDALLVALPAALLVGRPGPVAAYRALLAGSALLAARVVALLAWSAISGYLLQNAPDLVWEEAGEGSGPTLLGIAVPALLLALGVFGALLLGLGFRRARGRRRPAEGRGARSALVVGGLLAAILGLLLETRVVPLVPGSGAPGLVEVLEAIGGAALVLAWTWVGFEALAGFASRASPRHGWALAAAGATLLVLTELAAAVGFVALGAEVGRAAGEVDPGGLALVVSRSGFIVATLVRVLGLVLLLAGLARPMEPLDTGTDGPSS